jgi:hypothetical protein
MAHIHLEDRVLGSRIAPVRLQDDVDGSEAIAACIAHGSAECEEDRGAFGAQCVGWSSEGISRRHRLAEHRVQHRCCGDSALERRTSQCRPEIGRAKAVQHADDVIAAQVGRVRERWSPVAVVADERLLVDQLWIPGHQLPHGIAIVAPDGIHELDRLHESRPARRFVAPREDELRVSKPGLRRIDLVGM